MLKRFFIIGVFSLFFFLNSECKVIYNPDANTLWLEDGKDVEVGVHGKEGFWAGKYWAGKLEIESKEDGMKVKSPSNDKECSGRYFRFDRNYPYLVWEIDKKIIYGEGYRGLTMAFPHSVFNFVTHIYPGIFVVNPFLSKKDIKEFEYCRIYLYNTEIYFKYIKMVKKPDYLIEITGPEIEKKGYAEIGDEINFKVILKEEAEDVSLTFYDYYMTHETKINDKSSLQLKPEDEDQKIWTGKIKIEKIDKPGVGKDSFLPGNFLIKATVLGGKINIPIWTANWFEIKTKKEAK
ncbi:MAG: hypothetical protein ACP5OB_07545 [Candidatus Ratteibacteria bacterium]